MKEINDIAIIGGGPVGIFSIFAFGMQGLNSIIIDALPKLGGQCAVSYPEKYIYDIPGFSALTGYQLIENLTKQAFAFKPDVLLNSMVDDIVAQADYFTLHIKQNNEHIKIKARAIVLALGAGIFAPMKLDSADLKPFEGKQVLYFLEDLEKFRNKNIAIIGAGDSALDWALDLSNLANKIYLIHRREYIKAHPANWQKAQTHEKIEVKIPYMFSSAQVDNGQLQGIHIESCAIESRNTEYLAIDYLLPCFGIKSDIGFVGAWGLELANNRILVDQTTMRTSKPGIYAIGDCVYYNNKRKLILTGFSEAAQCAIDLFKHIYPDRALQIGHSTSLGVPGL